MSDRRNTKQLQMRMEREERELGKIRTRLPQAPRPKDRGNSGPLGHIVVGGETVSGPLFSDLPKSDRNRLTDFDHRPSWLK